MVMMAMMVMMMIIMVKIIITNKVPTENVKLGNFDIKCPFFERSCRTRIIF